MIPTGARQIKVLPRAPTKTYCIVNNRIVGFIDGQEAMKQMIYKALQTERYQHLIYSWRYGVELAELFGKQKGWIIPEAERRIREALVVDDRVIDVTSFQFEDLGKGQVLVRFTVATIFGELEEEVKISV